MKVKHDRLRFKKIDLKRISVLLGPNGAGKTTFIRYLKEKNPEAHLWTNSKDNHIHNKPNPFHHSEYNKLFMEKLAATERSEGENIVASFDAWLNSLKLGKNSMILIDEIDSGLSVDNINVLCHHLADIFNRYECFIVISANTYEIVRCFPESLFWMSTGKQVKIDSYEKYVEKYCKERVNLIKGGRDG